MNACPFCGGRVTAKDRNCPGCGGALPPDEDTSPSQTVSTLSAEEREILDLARRSKIAAVKRYRELTRVGLKEAKEGVEDLMARHGVVPQGGQGCATVLLFLLAGPVAIFWLTCL